MVITAAEGWHPGVVGLIAARLKEKFGRPAFAIALEPGGIGTGSGRSIAGVDIGRAVRRAVTVWAEGQVIGFNISEPSERSNTVTTVMMNNGHDPVALQRYCKEKCGVVLGVGIGELAGQAFRIAHMGHINAPMILGTLGVIEVGLNALDIPHGKGGTEAAIGWLGASVSA